MTIVMGSMIAGWHGAKSVLRTLHRDPKATGKEKAEPGVSL